MTAPVRSASAMHFWGPTDPTWQGTPETGPSQGAALGALQPGGGYLLPADRRRVAIPHGRRAARIYPAHTIQQIEVDDALEFAEQTEV